ncbi:phosphate acetyltransferase [Quadrisphaera oryzae]|uniref:phosphate acetyltransferase n=1 Tax=Quadrisphaera TaxID=317661 RepID=UPI001C9557A7
MSSANQRLYVTADRAGAGKTVVALGLLDLLASSVRRPVVFRPVVSSRDEPDPLVALLRHRYDLDIDDDDAVGLTWDEAAALVDTTDAGPDPRRLVATIVERVERLSERSDFVLVVGTDFTGPSPATELDLNALLAVNLGAPVVVVVSAAGAASEDTAALSGRVAGAAREAGSALAARGCTKLATVVNRVDPAHREAVLDAVRQQSGHTGGATKHPVYAVEEVPLLSALTVGEVASVLGGSVLTGSDSALEREVGGYLAGSAHADVVLRLLREGTLLVTSGDRLDLMLVSAGAAIHRDLPTPGGLVLTNGTRPDDLQLTLLRPSGLPMISVPTDTYTTIHRLEGATGAIRPTSQRKVTAALGAFSAGVDAEELSERIRLVRTEAVTPAMFNARLLAAARADRRTIVLPESEDTRVLRAAEELGHLDVADLVLLGREEEVRAQADRLGVDLGSARVVDPATSPLREQMAPVYAERRQHKGVTLEAALEQLLDPTYFGTLMVETGHADGMVSGATHTTAATIRPALEVIKTMPGASRVSGAFLMCLPDRVMVFADCAVNLDPTAEELAGIAISSAETARAFGVEPRVAMVSYSTGSSGAGVDVDKVREATRLVAERAPDLPLAGPIQYDAAVDPATGAAKMPDNPVAGNATVLVFPDLNTGNTTYKAVQRTGDAVAVGPVLQGLRRPVNDLSRGCTVADVVSTVAITAVQSQTTKKASA